MRDKADIFFVGFAVGAVLMALLSAFGILPPETRKQRALCERALAQATASDSLALARKPFVCYVGIFR